MRTPKALYPQETIVYTCEYEACFYCNGPLVNWPYVSSRKTVQTMRQTLRMIHQPQRCGQAACAGRETVWSSARWQQVAPRHSTYGYDVIAHIGWHRQRERQNFQQIQRGLDGRVQISEAHVRYLYYQSYLPLLACQERQRGPELAQMAQQAGLILAVDGLAPEGGEPQLWFVRELQTGLTVRSGWLSQQDEATFIRFLQPVAEQPWPIVAILSDKQRGLVPAVAAVFPQAQHTFCQAHHHNNLAEPLAETDNQLKVTLRQSLRQKVGDLVRCEPGEQPGVLTVTGLVPSQVETVLPPPAEASPALVSARESPTSPEQEEMVQAILRHVRYLLTLKGRPPFRLAGLEMFARLRTVVDSLDKMLAQHSDTRLLRLRDALRQTLTPFVPDFTQLAQAEGWLHQIAAILTPDDKTPRPGAVIRAELETFLDHIPLPEDAPPLLTAFRGHLGKTTTSYAPSLFHTYDIPGLPRTNNKLESTFCDGQRRLLATTGQKGLTKRLLHRSGAWELIPTPSTLTDVIEAISQVPPQDFRAERERVRQHRRRFSLHTRSIKQSQKQLDKLQQRWSTLHLE